MTPHRILQFNALFTAAGAIGMLALRGTLYSFFGLATPLLMDVIAIGLLGYAAALAAAAARQPVGRPTLMAFTAADAAWVVGSVVVLLLFWSQLAPLGRTLIIVVGLIVEGFATLQFRAATRAMTV
jgi:hypothetical protein